MGPSGDWRGESRGLWSTVTGRHGPVELGHLIRRYGSLPSHTKLGMPALSPTMSQGNLVEWKVEEGQAVEAGDVLAEVETDKATLGWENQDDGVVARLLVPNGTQNIDVGQIVAIMVDDEEDVVAFKDYVPEDASGAGGTKDVPDGAPAPSSSEAPAQFFGEHNIRIGPAARIMMENLKIDPSTVVPSGPNGIITKGDVIAASEGHVTKSDDARLGDDTCASIHAGSEKPKPPSDMPQTSPESPPVSEESVDYVDIPTTNMRKVIARRLLESKNTVPHMYASSDIKLDKIMELRAALASMGKKVSVNDCIIRAVALALDEVPAANCYWDTQSEKVVRCDSIDVSVAVATESGLFTPIVKDADNKSLGEISADVRSLAKKARENKLMPEEYQGGSFSVSNLGMFGVDSFSAIINPPQGCIMAVGGGRKVARIGNQGKPVTVTEMTVTLSADGRVYDGQTTADFLESFKKNMEEPFRLASMN